MTQFWKFMSSKASRVLSLHITRVSITSSFRNRLFLIDCNLSNAHFFALNIFKSISWCNVYWFRRKNIFHRNAANSVKSNVTQVQQIFACINVIANFTIFVVKSGTVILDSDSRAYNERMNEHIYSLHLSQFF